MIVYRTETPEGFGPYQSGMGLDITPISGDEDTHPLPENDGIDLRKYPNWVFGFATMDDFIRWFGSRISLTGLYYHGFEIVTFEVPDKHVKLGGRQVVFKRPSHPLTRTVLPWYAVYDAVRVYNERAKKA